MQSNFLCLPHHKFYAIYPSKEEGKEMKKILFLPAIVFCYMACLYFLQNQLIFHPHRYYQTPEAAGLSQFKELYVQSHDKTMLRLWYSAGDKEKPAVLYFHGNAYQNAFFAPYLKPFIDNGYTVLMMEYRGFGKTQGNLSQDTVFQDAAAAFDWLKKQNYPQIIVYGYSFGCAVSLGLSTLRTPDKIILTAPFASLIRLVKEKPVPLAGMVLRDYYPSEEYIKNYHNPLLIIHGMKDRLIPYHHSEILYENSTSDDKTLVLLPDETHKTVFMGEKNLPIIFKWLQTEQ